MIRVLFFMLALTGMLFAMTGVLLRLELFTPAAGPLFVQPDGEADGDRFERVANFHGLMGYLTASLLGTYACAVAARLNVGAAGFLTFLGYLISAVVLAVVVMFLIPLPDALPGDDAAAPVLGFSLSSIGPNVEPTSLGGALFRDWSLFNSRTLSFDVTTLLAFPAGAMLLLGAYALGATQQGYGLMGAVGLVAVLFATMIAAPLALTEPLSVALMMMQFGALPLLGFLAVQMIDRTAPGITVLSLGVIATNVAGWTLGVFDTFDPGAGDLLDAAALYIFPLGLGWFVLPAAMWINRPGWHAGAAPWVIGLGIIGALAFWIWPLAVLGIEGQADRTVAYFDFFGPENMAVTAAVFVFVLTFLASIIWVRRDGSTPFKP